MSLVIRFQCAEWWRTTPSLECGFLQYPTSIVVDEALNTDKLQHGHYLSKTSIDMCKKNVTQYWHHWQLCTDTTPLNTHNEP